jgi:hypothetical protein
MVTPTDRVNCAEDGIVTTESVEARNKQARMFFIVGDIRFLKEEVIE